MNECFQVAHSRFEGRRRRKLGHHTFSCGIEERRDDQMTQHEGPGRNDWRSGLGGKMKTYWSERREHSCLDSETWWGQFCTLLYPLFYREPVKRLQMRSYRVKYPGSGHKASSTLHQERDSMDFWYCWAASKWWTKVPTIPCDLASLLATWLSRPTRQ